MKNCTQMAVGGVSKKGPLLTPSVRKECPAHPAVHQCYLLTFHRPGPSFARSSLTAARCQPQAGDFCHQIISARVRPDVHLPLLSHTHAAYLSTSFQNNAAKRPAPSVTNNYDTELAPKGPSTTGTRHHRDPAAISSPLGGRLPRQPPPARPSPPRGWRSRGPAPVAPPSALPRAFPAARCLPPAGISSGEPWPRRAAGGRRQPPPPRGALRRGRPQPVGTRRCGNSPSSSFPPSFPFSPGRGGRGALRGQRQERPQGRGLGGEAAGEGCGERPPQERPPQELPPPPGACLAAPLFALAFVWSVTETAWKKQTNKQKAKPQRMQLWWLCLRPG